jgi:Family of unknown function (DUF6516)
VTTVDEYHQAVKVRLIADPLVLQFDIRRERSGISDGHLRARVTLSNGDQLEFSEYVHQAQGQIEIVTYSFHWSDSAGNLIRRWDNVPHFLHLSQAPDHIHDGSEQTVIPGMPTSLMQVLDEISAHLSHQGIE